MRQYVEISSQGIDESLQGISSSPFPSAFPTSVGLRVPTTALPQRYLFVLATRVVSKPCRIRGIRQYLSIGSSLPRVVGESQAATNPVTLSVTTPDFKFLDGNVSWHLVRESNPTKLWGPPPLTDAPNFRFMESASPALLYQTFTAAAGTTNPITGAPLFYPNALTAYTPPAIWGGWQPLAEDLFTFNDIRFPWNAQQAWTGTDIYVPVQAGSQRVTLYASVLQTSATALTIPAYPATLPQSAVLPPEWQFILTNFNLDPSRPTIYWRVGGALIFEDDI